jgi:nucleoside-diphosphate-sugar epimerase
MKNNELQTIVGSGGVIGNGLSTALREYTSKVRLVGRNPSKVNSDDELYPADALNFKAISEAVKGSKVVYLTLGLPYSVKVWQRDWPVVMDNVIKACQEHGARLVFFDNVYMYGLVKGAMTEETPVNPCSRKGEVRAEIAEKLWHEIKHNKFEALIARSADFYGPGAVNTFVHPMVFEKLKAGKKASWLGNDQVKHAFTFTTDAIKGTALLGNTNKAFGQLWHLPTHAAALTGKEFIEEVGAEFSIVTAPK